jgi:hypothetical protein
VTACGKLQIHCLVDWGDVILYIHAASPLPSLLHNRAEVPKLWGMPPQGGAYVVYMRDIFILNKIMAQDKICILIGNLLG